MDPGTLLFRIAVIAFLAWTLYRWGGGVYHFFHRRSLRRRGDTVIGTVISVQTIPTLSRRSHLVKIKCRLRYQAHDGVVRETAFRHTYLPGSVPRLGDVAEVYVDRSNPANAEADRYPRPPYAR